MDPDGAGGADEDHASKTVIKKNSKYKKNQIKTNLNMSIRMDKSSVTQSSPLHSPPPTATQHTMKEVVTLPPPVERH